MYNACCVNCQHRRCSRTPVNHELPKRAECSRVAGSKRSPGRRAITADEILPTENGSRDRLSSVAPETAVKLWKLLGHRSPDGATLADLAADPKWRLVRNGRERAQPGLCRSDSATRRRAVIPM